MITTKNNNSNKVSVPADEGYYFPAEWLEHEGILLAWPHDKITFPELDKVEIAYIKIIKSLESSEKVNLFVTGTKMRRRVENVLKLNNANMKNITFYEGNYADVWFRDYGPTFVVNTKLKKKAIIKWTFNAYGNKYKTLLKDNSVPLILNKKMKLQLFDAKIVCEGGAIESNGKGTLLTTTTCLLNKNRNPKKSKEQIESVLKNNLNIKKVIWLDNGILGDDTDGHIDNLVRFVNENTIVCSYADKTDINFKGLDDNFKQLQKETDQDGKPFNIIKLPLPKLFYKKDNKRLSASYANFYIGNKVILLPQFNLPTDLEAKSVLTKLFPKKTIIGIDCVDLIHGGGTLHCISQQIPKI